jgi:hypothetical protein
MNNQKLRKRLLKSKVEQDEQKYQHKKTNDELEVTKKQLSQI